MNDPKSPAASTQKRTLVEEGTRFKGSLTSTCPVVVQGSLEGDVESPAVTVSKTGDVSGIVVTSALHSEGKIAGDFDVDTAKVSGSVAKETVIRANAMDFKLAVETGKLELTFGPPGAKRR